MKFDFDKENRRHAVEKEEEWRQKIDVIPWLQFKPDWDVKVIPPFGGAFARFQVQRGDAAVSVYLDFECRLGIWTDDENNPEPYWEVYPLDDDVWRCAMLETDALIGAIQQSLDQKDGSK